MFSFLFPLSFHDTSTTHRVHFSYNIDFLDRANAAPTPSPSLRSGQERKLNDLCVKAELNRKSSQSQIKIGTDPLARQL